MTSATHEEYIVQTFTGSIVSFTSGDHPLGRTSSAVAAPQGKLDLKAEVAYLEADVKEIQATIEVSFVCTVAHSLLHFVLSVLLSSLHIDTAVV